VLSAALIAEETCLLDITTFVGRNWAADVLTIGPIVYVTPCDAVSALPIPAMVRDRTN